MKKVVVIAILAILFSLSAFAQTYQNNQFKIDYPNTWTKEKLITPTTFLRIFNPNYSTLIIMIEDYSGKEDNIWQIDDQIFQHNYIQSMRKQFSDTQLIDFKKIYLDNEPAFFLKTLYTVIDDDMQGGMPEMIKVEINCIYKNKIYKIIFETFDIENIDNTKEFQTILNTFKFK